MKKILMLGCLFVFAFQTTAYGEYADPLKNPWIFTLDEYWPGTEPIQGNGMTAKLKVPINDTDRTLFDLWQLDIPKQTSTNRVTHPVAIDETDPSFSEAGASIYKTAVVVKGKLEVYFSNCDIPYVAKARDTIHLVPDTPHRFKATEEDAVVMIYCYGSAVAKDEDKNFIKAYFDTAAVNDFTISPKDEDLICDQNAKDVNFLGPYNFLGPNNEIRQSLLRGTIIAKIDKNPVWNTYIKVAPFETEGKMEFVEFEWFDFDYFPHQHTDFLETMLITHKKATFWVGAGTENGQVDTSHPAFGIPVEGEIDYQGADREPHPADPARIGDGVRVEPGYVIYMPAGVPHAMVDTEYGNIWYATANPAASVGSTVTARSRAVYRKAEK